MSRYIHPHLLAAPLLLLASFCMSTPAASTEVDAAGYYKLRCATCHGPNGEGTRDKSPSLGPPLRGNPLVINAPAEILASIIRRGRGGQQRVYDDAYPNMPAFDAGLVPDAMGLAIYLKTVLQQTSTASGRADRAVFEPGDSHANRVATVRAVEGTGHANQPRNELVHEPIDGSGGRLHHSTLRSKGVSQ